MITVAIPRVYLVNNRDDKYIENDRGSGWGKHVVFSRWDVPNSER